MVVGSHPCAKTKAQDGARPLHGVADFGHNKTPRGDGVLVEKISMGRRLCLGDFAALDATGADADALGIAVDEGLDGLQVHVPAAAGNVVRVRNVIAELRTFAANVAYLCHGFAPNPVYCLTLGISCRRVRFAGVIFTRLASPFCIFRDGTSSGRMNTTQPLGFPNLQYTRNRALGQGWRPQQES